MKLKGILENQSKIILGKKKMENEWTKIFIQRYNIEDIKEEE